MFRNRRIHCCYVIQLVLIELYLACASPLERRGEYNSNAKATRTVMMNIDGQNVPVELPVDEVPADLPRYIHSKPRDERLDDGSIVILPNQLPEAPSFPQARDGNLTSPPSPSPQPLPPPNPPPPLILPAPAPAPPAPAPAPPAPAPAPPAQAPAAQTPPAQTPPAQNPPALTPLVPASPAPAPQQPPAPSPVPPPPPAATTVRPVTTAHHNDTSNIVLAAWLPMFGMPFFTNNLFGPIFPIFTPHPQVIQYITSPPVYYMQVLQIVHSLVPASTIPFASIMDLSMAVTNIMRSNAESLSSLVVDEPDGPNLAPLVQNAYGDNGFRSNIGETLDIPTPNDVTTQIQNAVQTYAQPVPEEVQNELTNALSENMAELLKPLYQNIAYTRKLRLGDTGEQLERREYSFIQRRSPNDTVVVPVPVVNVTTPAVNTTLPPVSATLATPPAVITNTTTTAANPTPPAPPPPPAPDSTPTTPTVHIPTLPIPNGVIPTIHPNLVNTMNQVASAPAPAPPAPAPIQPIVINNHVDPSSKNISNMGAEVMNELLQAPTSALSSFPSLLSFIPNPFKIVYGFMNTIATCYPKIQLSILVGLSTAITQIVARVLEMIASFVGIFAAIGRKRRDISSGDLVPSSIDMDQVLKDLHKDIKEAVNTYVPDAPPNVKKELTSGLYQNSLETINEALIPMGEQIKNNSQNAETNNPLPESLQLSSNLASAPESPPPPNNIATAPDYQAPVEVPPQPSSPAQDANAENLRTNLFGFQTPDIVIKLDNNNNNDLSLGNTLTGVPDDLQKQVNQFANDLVQLPQDMLGLSNYDTFQQNNGRQNSKNQNDIFSWNK
uniref:Uncharacterized protein n=1 Tax=Cacopsylla melanoneura TaxID=428564 RepID=A0A8D8RWD0_9HEMI